MQQESGKGMQQRPGGGAQEAMLIRSVVPLALVYILLMALMLVRSFRPGNYAGGEAGVASVSLFWHFVDVIWIVLFLLIYVWQ